MRRIGVYLGFPPQGGGAFQYAQSVLSALSALPQNEFEVLAVYTLSAWQDKLITYSHVKAVQLDEGYFSSMIKMALRFGFPVNVWRKFATMQHAFTRHCMRLQCDVWIFPSQDVWSYAIPVPGIGVIHDLMHRHEARFPEVSSFGLYHRRERHYRNLCRYTLAILVDSELGKQHVLDAYAPSRDKVFCLPFVAPHYLSQPETEQGFDYTLPERFLFYPAQFWKHKNHHRLIQAFAQARAFCPDLHLVLVGSKKNAYASVVKLIKQLRLEAYVHILGYVDDRHMRYLYQQARALIFPSFFGPTNIPPLEAMFLGCPMAVSGIYAMPERLGDAAIYFDPDSTEQLSQAIQNLAADDELCESLRKNALRKAKQWTQTHFNSGLENTLRQVLPR